MARFSRLVNPHLPYSQESISSCVGSAVSHCRGYESSRGSCGSCGFGVASLRSGGILISMIILISMTVMSLIATAGRFAPLDPIHWDSLCSSM